MTRASIAQRCVSPVRGWWPGRSGRNYLRVDVDTGYLDADLLVTSKREYGVELLGPTLSDYKCQARAAECGDAAISRSTGRTNALSARQGSARKMLSTAVVCAAPR